MSLFYIGLNPRWQMYRFLPDGINIMFSAAGYCDFDSYGDFVDWRRPIKRFPKKTGKRWLDCGGYLLLNKFGHYPFSVVNYANLQAVLRADYYASMDYPCEPDISRMLGLMSNEDRIRQTVKNAEILSELKNHLPGQMVPVIQGYELDEYKYCLDLYHSAGLIRSYMAVGSMCRRISSQELNNLIPGIYHHARNHGVERLHFFGLKLSPDLKSLQEYIYSRDSAVALDDYDIRLRKQRNGRRFPRGQKEKKAVFFSFIDRLNDLNLRYTV